ncbi:MAG: DegV family protein [Coriobacteriales bacterium]|nr:DegV family protein [Coriobacteriales bacterium]
MATRNRLCNLIIDSCCDLPAELVESYDVEVIKFTFTMDDGEHLDDLGVSMSGHEFYEHMRKGAQPRTAQVPYADICDKFEHAAQSGVPTVCLCFSSGLSGTFETVTRVHEETRQAYPDAEIYVVDTRLASAAEGLLVMEAVRQCDRGLTASELAAWAEEAKYYVHGYFTIADMEVLRRGGRIPDMAAIVGSKLDIRPILTFDLDGHLAFFGAARGRKKSIRQLLQMYEDRVQESSPRIVLVAGADADKERKSLAEQVLKMPRKMAVWQVGIGPVIGSHVGPDMLAVVFWGPDRRESISLTDRIANAVSERSEAIKSHFTAQGASTQDTTTDKDTE